MATEKIRIDYKVNKKELDASNKSLEQSQKENDLLQKEIDETNKKFKKQDKQLSKTNKAFAGIGGQLTALGNNFEIAGKGLGDMAAGMFKATTATSLTSKAMKVLRFAIASTGIGLLVVALASLVTFFTKSQKGSDLLSKAMGRIGDIVEVLLIKLANFGEILVKVFSNPKQAIKDLAKLIKENIVNRFEGLIELIPALGTAIRQLFSGDFADAAETAGNAVGKVVLGVEDITDKIKGAVEGMKALGDEFSQAIIDSDKLQAMIIRMEETEIRVTSSVAKRTKLIQEQLLATKNNTLSFIEQKEALDLVQKLQIENEKELMDLAQQRLDIAIEEVSPEALRTREELLIVSKAQATFEKAIANSKARQRDTANRQTELANRIILAARAQATEEANIAEEKEKQRLEEETLAADTLEKKKQAISDLEVFTLESEGRLVEAEEERTRRILENVELIEAERQLIIKQSEANIIAIKEAAAEEEKELSAVVNDDITTGKEAGLDAAKGLIVEGLGDSKEGALFTTAINTQDAAVAAFKAVVGIPVVGPALAPIAAAAAVAFGLKSIAKITSTNLKFEKGGRIGGNLHSGGGTLIEAERDEFMMSRKATSKYGFEFMDKINNLELNDLTTGGDMGSINIIDTNPIAEQLKNMPQTILNVDDAGFALHQRRGHNMMSQKILRYST